MPGFDIDAARKAGYSDTEIADEIAKAGKFNVQGARSAGYNDKDILSEYQKGIASQQPAPFNPADIKGNLAHDTLAASPMLPEGIVAAGPARLLASLGGGSLGGKLAQAAAEKLGLSPENQQRAHFAGGVVGGALGGAAVPGGLASIQARSNPLTTPQAPAAPANSATSGFTLPPVNPTLDAIGHFLPGGPTGLRIYNAVKRILDKSNAEDAAAKTKNYPAPKVTYPQRQAPVAAPPVSYPNRPGPVAAPPVTFADRPSPVAAPPVSYPQQAAAPRAVPAPPVTFPAQVPPTRVVPPPPLSWLTRAEDAPAVPAGTDKVVIKNGQPFVNQNGKLATPPAKAILAGPPRGANGKFISAMEKQLQDSIQQALAKKNK